MNAVDAAREYAQSLTETNESTLWEVLDFERPTTKADWSAHKYFLLRPVSELSAQCLHMLLVHWRQQQVCRAEAATGFAGVSTYATGEKAARPCR